MNASMTGGTLGPVPTFSPSFTQGAVTPAEIGLAWKILPASAMVWACWRASAVSCASTISGGAPTRARVWFSNATNWASSALGLSPLASALPATAKSSDATRAKRTNCALRFVVCTHLLERSGEYHIDRRRGAVTLSGHLAEKPTLCRREGPGSAIGPGAMAASRRQRDHPVGEPGGDHRRPPR